MESKLNLKKIVMILAFTSLISFACLLSGSKYEKGPEVESDYFSFAEPRLKDDPRYYDVDEYDESVYIFDDDDEVAIVVSIGYGDTRDLERQLDHFLGDMDIRGESDPKDIKVGGFPAVSVTYEDDDADGSSIAAQFIVVDLQDEADDEVYLFIIAGCSIDDEDELEEALERFDDDVEPMLDIVLDTLEFFDLDEFE